VVLSGLEEDLGHEAHLTFVGRSWTGSGSGAGDGVLVVEVVVVETHDGRDGDDGGQEPEGKVALAVVVHMAEGSAKEGDLDLVVVVVQETARLVVGSLGGTVVGHGLGC